MDKKRPQDISSLERMERVNSVHTLILQGVTSSQIIEFCRQNYKTDRSTSYNYINDAKEIIKENFEKTFDKETFKAEIYARLENLYQQSFEIDDFKECRNILKDLRDMLGLNEPIKSDVTTNGQAINQPLTIEQAKKLADELNNEY